MEECRNPLVLAVEDLGVDYELHVNPDGTHTVHIRYGLPFGHEAAAMINDLARHNNVHCPVCTGVLLKSAGIAPGTDQASALTRLIQAAAHHNWHLAHGRELVCEQRTGSGQSRHQPDPCSC